MATTDGIRAGSLAGLEILTQILERFPFGLSEYALLSELARLGVPGFEGRAENSSELFRRHFLLFNGLYRLRQKFRTECDRDLEIHCLGIRFLPGPPRPIERAQAGLPMRLDALELYYLDESELERCGPDEIEAMLDAFWQRFAAEESREDAIATLDLSANASEPAIERRYRELALRHHPDRGGCPDAFHRVHAAVSTLRARSAN